MNQVMTQFPTFVLHHWELWLAFIVILLCLASVELLDHFRGIKGLSPATVTQLMNRHDAVIIDVRDQSAYQRGHILGAQAITAKELPDKIDKLEKYKQKHVIIVCPDGNTGGSLAYKLLSAGFMQVGYLKGGMSAWQRANLPVQRG